LISKLLLELGASPHITNSFGYLPIHIAAKVGIENFCTLLVKNKADVNSKTPSNMTPLHIAILENNVNIIIELINLGANLNMKEEGNKETPLLLACSLGNEKIIQLLVENGAKLDDYDEEGNTGLMLACENEHLNCVKYILTVGVSPNEVSKLKKWSPLHFSSSNGNIEITKLLINYKAIVNIEDYKKRTPLHIASLKGFVNCIKY